MSGATIACSVLVAFASAAWLGLLPWWLAAWYLLLSAATALAYYRDKAAAGNGGPRIAENTLHLMALLGGWPGAVFAQSLFRHKTVKPSFRRVFWCTLLLNCAVLGYAIQSVH